MIKPWTLVVLLALAAPGLAEAQEKDKRSLYERLGGMAPISVVVDEFIDRLLVDDTLNANPRIKEARARVPAAYLKFHVTSMVCQVTGGPCKYIGRGMRESHAHLGISEKEWNQMARVFQNVLERHKVPAAEQKELFDIVGSTKGEVVTATASK